MDLKDLYILYDVPICCRTNFFPFYRNDTKRGSSEIKSNCHSAAANMKHGHKQGSKTAQTFLRVISYVFKQKFRINTDRR
jgi:hypothetical protein